MKKARWLRFKSFVPIVQPFPARTFPTRLAAKSQKLAIYILHIGLCALGIKGAKIVGSTSYGSMLLQLNLPKPLGMAGKVISVPRDEVMFRSLRFYGEWEIQECHFLSDALKRLSRAKKVAFLDLGANTGIVTLQTMGLAQTNAEAILVEPLPLHVECINFNVADLRKTNEVYVFPFALGKANGKTQIFTQSYNYGNTSLISSNMPAKESIISEIMMRKTEDFLEESLRGYSDYVLKSDLQGYDAVVLASISKTIWDRTEAAVVEIWALEQIDYSDVDRLIQLWGSFNSICWSFNPKTKISLSELANFWLNRSGDSRNVFMMK
jgi:FkbM family methyltransferase